MAMNRWYGRFPSEMDDGQHCTFYYQIDRSLNYNRSIIEEAMHEIESYSRMRFEPRQSERCYLTLTKNNGCWTTGTGQDCRPRISLGMGCQDLGTILHELLHAIGFEHEHCRPDRGDYVRINWRNIEVGNEDQFEKLRESQYDWMDFRFDFKSIMMYHSYEFSRNGEMTIQRLNGGEIKRNNELSRIDKLKLRRL